MKTSLAKNTRAGNQTSVKNDSTFVKCALGAIEIAGMVLIAGGLAAIDGRPLRLLRRRRAAGAT